MDCPNFSSNTGSSENDRQQDGNSSDSSHEEEDSNSAVRGIDQDVIESKLKGLGINRRNVRTMICEIFKEPNITDILGSNPEDGGQDNRTKRKVELVSRNLRSKKVEDKSTLPSFVDLPLPDDDPDDTEYDVAGDLVQAKKMKLDMLVPSGDETTPDTTPNINERYDEEEAATLIARKTRSKHQVNEEEQGQVEAVTASHPFFKEDDSKDSAATDEESNGDSEFQKFITDAWGTNQKEEEDSDRDPDYNFLAATESIDHDDSFDVYRPKLQISKKEVKELIKQSNVQVERLLEKDSKPATLSDSRATITTVTVKEKLSKMRETKGEKRKNPSDDISHQQQHSNEGKLNEEACSSVPSESNTREGLMGELFGDVGNSIMDTCDFVENFANKQATSSAAQPLMHNEVSSSSFSSVATAEDSNPKRTAAVFESNNKNAKKESRTKNSTTQPPLDATPPPPPSSSVNRRGRKLRVASSPSSSSDNKTVQQPEKSKREAKPSRRVKEMTDSTTAQTASAPGECKKRGVKRKGKKAATAEVETNKETTESSGNLKVVLRSKRPRQMQMHELHPALSGKELNGESRSSFARNLQRMADSIRPLEENTMIQDDPTKSFKDQIFASGYMERVQAELDPKTLTKFLRVVTNFGGDNKQSPAELVRKLRVVFTNHPHLATGFAPFILPQQAAQCGLLSEHLIYHRVRTFLRNVEFRYQNDQPVLEKILSVFTRIAKEAQYSYKAMKRSVLEELKDNLDLQDEFRMIFDDERPPVHRLHDESEMTQGDVSSDRSYEMLHVNNKKIVEAADTSIHFKTSTSRRRKKMVNADATSEEKGQKKDAPSTELGSKTSKQTSSGKDRKGSDVKAEEHPTPEVVTSSENKDVIRDESSKNNEKVEERLPSAFQPYTSQSSQKPAEETENKETIPKVTTPVKVVEKPKPEAEEEKKEKEAKHEPWTPSEDTQLLVACKKFPTNINRAFEDISKTTSRSIPHVKQRFHELMSFLAQKNKKEESSESDDDDDDSSDDDDESDSDSGSED